MNVSEFKNVLNEFLLNNSFKKKRGHYFLKNNQIICTIGLQKSNYSNAYYIESGILIKDINPTLEFPRYHECHYRSRFDFTRNYKNVELLQEYNYIDERAIDYVNLDELDDLEYLRRALEINMEKVIKPILTIEGLKKLVETNPILSCVLTLELKKYLGYR